jgi:hypoxanthine phosphoribosyltransferase
MEYLLARLDACEGDLSVLVLDDIFDSGRSYAAIRDALYRHGIERRIGRLNRMDEINQEIVVLKSLLEQPVIAGELYATTDEKNDVKNASANNYVYARDLRIGTVYYKPTKNQTPYTPDYYVEETTEWVVFGHELEGLTDSEITEYFGEDVLKMLNA